MMSDCLHYWWIFDVFQPSEILSTILNTLQSRMSSPRSGFGLCQTRTGLLRLTHLT